MESFKSVCCVSVSFCYYCFVSDDENIFLWIIGHSVFDKRQSAFGIQNFKFATVAQNFKYNTKSKSGVECKKHNIDSIFHVQTLNILNTKYKCTLYICFLLVPDLRIDFEQFIRIIMEMDFCFVSIRLYETQNVGN